MLLVIKRADSWAIMGVKVRKKGRSPEGKSPEEISPKGKSPKSEGS